LDGFNPGNVRHGVFFPRSSLQVTYSCLAFRLSSVRLSGILFSRLSGPVTDSPFLTSCLVALSGSLVSGFSLRPETLCTGASDSRSLVLDLNLLVFFPCLLRVRPALSSYSLSFLVCLAPLPQFSDQS